MPGTSALFTWPLFPVVFSFKECLWSSASCLTAGWQDSPAERKRSPRRALLPQLVVEAVAEPALVQVGAGLGRD